MKTHGCEAERRREAGDDHEGEVGRHLVFVEVDESLRERDGEQEARQNLSTGLDDPQLLQQLAPVALQTIVFGLDLGGVRGKAGHARIVPVGRERQRCRPA